MKDLFGREQQVYDDAIKHINADAEPDRNTLANLANEYGRLLKQLRRITKLSDRTAVDLNASKLDMLEKLLRMSSLAESSPNFISYKKFTGECVYLNPAASVLTGYSHDELMKDYIGILFDEETANHLRREIPAVLRKNGIVNYEASAKSKDGGKRFFSACSFLVESDEEAFGTVAIDITEKKKIEMEKLDALEKAELASRAKSDFLSRMNHEMRTPMNAIIGMATLAQKARDIDEAHNFLESINAAAAQLLGIIDDVLDMSKIYAGETEVSEESFYLQELLDQIKAVMAMKFEAKRQLYSTETDDGALKTRIVADKQKLARVITNLLDNANKFTPEGGIITLTARKTTVSDRMCELSFTIEDNGIGIAYEQQSRIFNVFEQSDNTINRQYGGTGLGLAISQKFVNIMGGEISVESKPGNGSKFSFTVIAGNESVCADEISDDEIGDTDSLENIFSGRHVLLVDDVEINRKY